MEEKITILKANFIKIFLIILLVSGTIIGVYLVQNKQIFKSKASQEIYNAFEFSQTTNQGQVPVSCSGNSCTTNSLDIQVKVKDLQNLTGE